MWAYVKKHRRKFYAAAAVGVGAASAYYCYSRWTRNGATEQSGDREAACGSSTAHPSSEACCADTSPLDCHLEQHFETIQSISGDTTLPAMMPQLMDVLFRMANVEEVTERLKQSRHSGAVSQAEKNALWQELKIVSFTRTLSGCWAIPLLDLLLRCQLNLLGRNMYLQAVANGGRGDSAEAASQQLLRGLPISPRVQEMFLYHAEFLSQCGLEGIMAIIRQAVVKVVGPVGLKETVDLQQLLQYISTIHEEFESELTRVGYAAFLLPSTEQVQAAMLSLPNPSVLAAPPGQLPDEEVVLQLVSQLRTTMGSQQFGSAVRGAVQTPAKLVTEHISSCMSAPLPLAKLLPVVAGATQQLVEHRQHLTADIAQVPQVLDLCAMVYAGDVA